MEEWEIDLRIDDAFQSRVQEEDMEQVVRQVLSIEKAGPLELSLYITDEVTVRDLNLHYREIDEPTDVLSFPMDPGEGPGEDFILPAGVPHSLGEIVISYPQAEKQAMERGHLPRQELTLLVVHGVLHLLGHDHEKPADAAMMAAREREILGDMGISTGIIDRAGI